jgi:MFS family permease/HEAT repeat protein
VSTHKPYDHPPDDRTDDSQVQDSAQRARVASDLSSLVARLNSLGEIFRVQGEILAAGRATVPALALFLEGPPSVFPQPRVAAAECLGILGGEAALAALLAAVAREHRSIGDPVTAAAEECVRNTAARQLARFHGPRVVPALLAALSADHLIGAGESLAARGETAAIPHLVECLEDDAKRTLALEALRRFGVAVIPELTRALLSAHQVFGTETPSSVIRRAAAAELLGELHAAAALPALRAAVAEARERVSIAAAVALAEIAPGEAVAGPLLLGLDDPDVVTQAACDAALRRLAPAAGTLSAAPLPPSGGARDGAESRRATNHRKRLGSLVDAVRLAAVAGTATLPSGETRRLSAHARRRATALLRVLAPAEFIEAGPALLADADAAVRYQAVRELTEVPPPLGVDLLSGARHDRDPRVRAAARAAEGAPPGATGSWLNRNVIGMGVTSLLSDAGHEMATAILPAFLATIGAAAAALGAIEGVADAVSSFAKLGAGWWSDRLGHRKTIAVSGYALTGASTGMFALATGWPLVFAARVIGWFGRGIRGALRDAMLAESVDPTQVGKAFGFHRAGDTLGAVIGPLLGVAVIGLLHPRFTNPSAPFRIVFLLTLIPGLGAALAFALLVRERRRAPNHALAFWHSVRRLPRPYRRFLVGVFVFGLADFAPTLLILRATGVLAPVHGIAHAAQLAAILYGLRNVFYAAAAYPVGALADRIGRRGLLAAGYALAALTFIGFMRATTDLAYLALLFAAAGVFIAVEDALEGAIAAELLPAETRGLGYGVLGSVNGVGDLLSSVTVGLLWTHVSAGAGLLYAMLSLIGAALILRVR